MIMEDYQDWVSIPTNAAWGEGKDDPLNFFVFFQEYYMGKRQLEILGDLAYHIYFLQVCLEGILEDRELEDAH